MRKLTASLALMLYLGPFFGQTLCMVEPDDTGSNGAAHQTATGHHSPTTSTADSDGDGSHHGEHSEAPGQAGPCPMATCAAAIAVGAQDLIVRDTSPGGDFLSSIDGLARPGQETDPPPPRLG